MKELSICQCSNAQVADGETFRRMVVNPVLPKNENLVASVGKTYSKFNGETVLYFIICTNCQLLMLY
jgi:hypothetical protein